MCMPGVFMQSLAQMLSYFPATLKFSSLHCEEPRSHKRVNTQVSGTFPLLFTYIRLAVAAWLGLNSYTEWKNVTQWT